MPFPCDTLSEETFNSWKTATSTSISDYQNKGSTTAVDNANMLGTEKEILDASLCISAKIKTLSSATNSIAALHKNIIDKTAELLRAEKDISIAKDRVSYIRHPEQNTSHYESWFPIDRPISIFSMIVIVCVTVFIGFFLILLFLSYFGLNISMYSENNGESTIFSAILQQFTISFWIVLIAFISVTIYFVRSK